LTVCSLFQFLIAAVLAVAAAAPSRDYAAPKHIEILKQEIEGLRDSKAYD